MLAQTKNNTTKKKRGGSDGGDKSSNKEMVELLLERNRLRKTAGELQNLLWKQKEKIAALTNEQRALGDMKDQLDSLKAQIDCSGVTLTKTAAKPSTSSGDASKPATPSSTSEGGGKGAAEEEASTGKQRKKRGGISHGAVK